ncbi:MAG TPA: NAD(P)/FAD-dependent oxidoreductase [Polyangia bacterium]|nr:NAD(P)/FAD-dependent oxidoreductase [Polyangia bacterium]
MRSRNILLVSITAAALTLLGFSCAPGQRLSHSGDYDYDAVVVGAGMGGLSAATHLAVGGLKVLVLEQHSKVGGMATSFTRGDFTFDVALHEMSLGSGDGSLLNSLEAAGIADRVELIRVPKLYRAVFPGFDFTIENDFQKVQDDLCARWPEECDDIRAYHVLMHQIHDDLIALRDLYRRSAITAALLKLTVPIKQPTLFKYHKHTVAQVLDEYFEDPELKAVLGAFWPYYGPQPSRLYAPTFLLANYSYHTAGAWQIKGTAQVLAEAYRARIEELGGEVRTGTRVDRILVGRKGVTGVVTAEGETIETRYVVSNADPFQTFNRLVGEERTPRETQKALETMKPSNSLVGVYLGLDVEPSFFGVDDYEIFWFSSLDADAMHAAMMEGRWQEGALSITIYSNLDPASYAPPGKSVVVLNAYSSMESWPERGPGYEQAKAAMVETLIDIAGKALPGLRDHIEVKEGMTPRTIAQYTSQHLGVPYGWESTPEQNMRMHNATPIPGLFLAGAWTMPFHGVSVAQLSGQKAAMLILDQERE